MIVLPDKTTRLLSRQIKKVFSNGKVTPENIDTFIDLVNTAYIAYDEDRLFYERAEKLASDELRYLLNKNHELISLLNEAQTIANLGGWELDLSTGKTTWTDQVYAIYEVEKDFDHSKKRGLEYYHPEDRPLIEQALDNAGKTNEPFDIVCRFITAKGNHKWVRVSGRAVVNGFKSGKLVGIFQDITARKKAEEEQERLLKITQSQNERLQNFAHIVAHNLKSHSGNISSLISIVGEESPELQGSEFFEYLKNASDNLTEAILHLSEVAQLQTDSPKQLKPINICQIIDKAMANVVALANKVQLKLINELHGDEMVMGDITYLDSIILNFLTNAIKYRSDERDSFVRFKSHNQNGYLVISIEDNGLGIDLKTQGHKLFGMFKTFHNHPDARGVGLFITKNQIEALGGKVEVESEVDLGTTFKIYLRNGNL